MVKNSANKPAHIAFFLSIRNPQIFRFVAAFLIVMFPMVLNAGALTPSDGIEQSRRPGDFRQRLPEFEETEPSKLLDLPDIIVPDEKKDYLSTAEKVYIKAIELTGNTIFSGAELSQITSQYENRYVYNDELEELRKALTIYYIEKGFINSGAVIPDQTISDGIVQIKIIEGLLTRIDIEGNQRLRTPYLNGRMALDTGTPLNVFALEEKLQLLLQNPAIGRINTELRPGDNPGEAVLHARVEEQSPYYLNLIFNNNVSPSVGSVQGIVQAGHYNVTGWSDVLSMQADFADELREIFLDYSIPITASDTKVSFHYDQSDATVIEEPFDVLDIESESRTFGMMISHPFFRTRQQQFLMSVSIEDRHSETTLLGFPFSFAPGVRDGESDVAVIRLTQEWLDRSQDNVISLRSVFNFGIDAFGATINDSLPDGEFFVWLGQFQWAHRQDNGKGQFIARTDIQVSHDPLLPLEKYSIGGLYSIRGYRRNQLVRDQGFTASLEYRRDMLDLKDHGLGMIQIAPFVDIGGAWNVDSPNISPNTLASIGVGLLWDPTDKFHAEIYWAHAFRDVTNPSNDIQDDGIHFQIFARLF